jgi:hypothetical protein
MKILTGTAWRKTPYLVFPFFSELILSRADQHSIKELTPIGKDIDQTESLGSGGTAAEPENLADSHFT